MGYDPRHTLHTRGLGTPMNPITNASAVRPEYLNGLSAHWRTATSPINAMTGDTVDLPEGTVYTNPTYLYEEHFDADTGLWTARQAPGNGPTTASNVARDITRDAGAGTTTASLRWTTNALGSTYVQGPGVEGIIAGTSYTMRAWISNDDTAARICTINWDELSGTGDYLGGKFSGNVSVPVGAGFTEIYLTATVGADVAQIKPYIEVQGASGGRNFYVDRITVA